MIKLKKVIGWILTVAMLAANISFIPQQSASAAVDFNAMPIPTLNTVQNGYNICRTMYLLESSTAEKPNTVRIAVTGQSISDGNNIWVLNLITWLRGKYPTANIVFQNFAIGGFATSILYKRVPNDMASFFPDLVIFYDYGDQNLYERMIKCIRETTGAEVMMQTEHYTAPSDWSDSMSYTILPDIAKNNNAELCRLREPWKKYLETYNLQPSALLIDGVHLNADGQAFMLGLMKQFFVYRPSNAAQVVAAQTKAIQASDWVNGKLTIPFKGTRAEVIAGSGQQYSAGVTVDGKMPSQYKECYVRSAESLGMYDTNLGIINFNSVPLEQLWTLEITARPDVKTFTVKASGSVTGNEGTSVYNVLNGAHLKIDSESFIWNYTPPTVGKKYTFSSILNGCDTYNGSKNVLFSGLTNGNHSLVLTATNSNEIPDIKSVRVYDPTVRAISDETMPTFDVPNKPVAYSVTDKSKKISGYTFDNGTITVLIGSLKFTTTTKSNGDWSVTLPKTLKVNTKITITITVKGIPSKARLLFVKPTAPTVNKTTSKSTTISGKTYAKAKVSIGINNKWKAVVASTKGLFSLKLSSKLKKGSSFVVKVTYLKQVSEEKTVKVY